MDIFFEDKKKPNENHKEVVSNAVNIEMNVKIEEEKKYEDYNIAEGNEKAIEEKLEVLDKHREENVYHRNIEYDMSISKKQVRMKEEDKYEMEKMRRWNIKIYNIYITPLMEMMDPFLQFTIGGDFQIEVYTTKKGDSYKIPKGKRGFADKTEVQQNVDKLERRPYDKIIDIEMRMTYSMVSKQKLMVEIWDYNLIWMNQIKAYTTMQIIDVVNGNCNITMDLTKQESGKKRPIPFARVEYKCVFQEIWDFKLSFINWKASCILPPKRVKNAGVIEKYPNSQIEIELATTDCIKFNNKSISEEAQNSDIPMWSNFKGCIVFRGTSSELENESAHVKLSDTTGVFKKLLSEKIVSLKGLLDSERIKTDMTLLDTNKEKYHVEVEGFVNIPNRPKYRQTGENVVLFSSRKYLCINVMRVENIRPAETRGIVDSFISVEWCGIVQRSRTVKENNNPTFNEMLYFQVPFPPEFMMYPEKYVQKINEEFVSKNEITFNLMLEGDDNTYDNLGIAFFHLSEIKDGERQEKKYFADDLKKDKKYVSRIYTGKSKMTSAFSLSNNTHVNFEAWFLDDFPGVIDFGEKKKLSERADKIPIDLAPFLEGGKDLFIDKLKREIQKVFSKYTNYSYKERLFYNIKPMDQYKNFHLLPYYVSLITMPDKLFSLDDRGKDPNFFDCNLRSLDEISHYVRCIPYSATDNVNEIWASPDFTLKIRKGGVEDHAILMASLMMGLQKTKGKVKYFEVNSNINDSKSTNNNDKTAIGIGSTNSATGTGIGTGTNTNNGTNNDIIFTQMNEKIVFPYEHRTFVCLGKLKITREPYIWVLTISDDYRDVTLWDPKLFIKYELQSRVDDPNKLKNFLLGKFPDYESVKRGKAIEPVEEESEDEEDEVKPKKKDLDQIMLRGLGEDSILEYKEGDDIYKDQLMDEKDHLLLDYDFVTKNEDEKAYVKLKNVNPQSIDENITYSKENIAKFNFLKEQEKNIDSEIKQSSEINFLPVDNFKDRSGNYIKEQLNMPYQTIDVIFNRNNIYSNMQFHDPYLIKYNLYDNDFWRPYVTLNNDGIFRGRFEPFYSLTNFGPCYSPGLVNKMKESLIKEMRVGITAARSGMNLQTKFKKKNEVINAFLQQYCDYTEARALNRISETELNQKILDWEDNIRSKMPKFYRMEARVVFFNFYEPEMIRRSITEDMEYFYNSKIKNLMFATSAKVYPYMNQIVSVRIMIAKFYKIPLEDINDKAEEMEYKKILLVDPTKLVEEEKDSDEDDEDLVKLNNGITVGNKGTPTKDEEIKQIKDVKIVKVDKK